MVKVREFCCGCSLRSGTLSIAWSLLILLPLDLILSSDEFFRDLRLSKNTSNEIDPPSSWEFIVDTIGSTVGIIISIVTIWAVLKNKTKFLNTLIWYLYFRVINSMVFMAVLLTAALFKSSNKSGTNYPQSISLNIYQHEPVEELVSMILLQLFLAGILSYMVLVVRSYRDYSVRNEAQDVEYIGSDPTTVGFRSIHI